MKLRISVAQGMAAFGFVVLAGFAAVVWTGTAALSELKVGGPIYTRIVQGKDLIADILPPPEYVIEAYLEATLAVKEPASLTEHVDRLKQLRKDYDDRHQYWLDQVLDAELKDKLVVKSDAEVAAFWKELDGALLPALKSGDTAAGEQAYENLKRHYLAHRAVIDEIVADTNAQNARTEASAAASDSRFTTIVWSVAGSVVLVVLGGIAAILLGVVKPIQRMTGAMTAISGGKLDIEIPSAGRRDEIGAMAGALDVFRRNAQETQRLKEEQDRLAKQAEEEKAEALRTMADRVERETAEAVNSISTLTGQMADNASRMAVSAGSVSANSQNVAAAATQALANAHTVSAAAEELSASIAEISSQVTTARSVTDGAVTASRSAEQTISELSEVVNKIGDVTKLISEIANQTNLLALNATIEAARAGDAGKGFAVVAHEVKSLANQTAAATGDITQQINAVREVTGRAVKSVQEIGTSIRGVEVASAAIAAAIEEQTATTMEIARNVTETTVASQEVADRINGVSSEAAATGESAGEVNKLCTGVAGGIDSLRKTLVRVVRTATKEVDRRRKPRFEVKWNAVIRASGRDYRAVVGNCSLGGAMIAVAEAIPQALHNIELRIDGFPDSLPAHVLRTVGERLHVKFDLSPDVAQRYGARFQQLVSGMQPLATAA